MASSQVRIPRSRARAVSILAIAGVVLTLATTAHGSPVFGPKDYLVQPGLPLPAIERFPPVSRNEAASSGSRTDQVVALGSRSPWWRSPPLGFTTCSLIAMALPAQPPNVLTEHPV